MEKEFIAGIKDKFMKVYFHMVSDRDLEFYQMAKEILI